MIELFITNKDFFDVYFSDLNVPIAYIILTISIFLIMRYKKYPLIYSFFFWISSGFGVAGLFDAVYDYQIKIFVFHNMSIGEGLLFLLFPIGTYAFIYYNWRFKNIKWCSILIFPIITEIIFTIIQLQDNKDYSAMLRYSYVLTFIYILLNIKKYEKNKN